MWLTGLLNLLVTPKCPEFQREHCSLQPYSLLGSLLPQKQAVRTGINSNNERVLNAGTRLQAGTRFVDRCGSTNYLRNSCAVAAACRVAFKAHLNVSRREISRSE